MANIHQPEYWHGDDHDLLEPLGWRRRRGLPRRTLTPRAPRDRTDSEQMKKKLCDDLLEL